MKSIIELREEAIEKDINLEVLEYKMLEEKDEEIERLHSIIKEVREYIEENKHFYMFDFGDFEDTKIYKALSLILDKVEENSK